MNETFDGNRKIIVYDFKVEGNKENYKIALRNLKQTIQNFDSKFGIFMKKILVGKKLKEIYPGKLDESNVFSIQRIDLNKADKFRVYLQKFIMIN